jgi:pimeloyl-ACP methyl ester carboxylesterase
VGYGESEAWPDYSGFDSSADVEVIRRLADLSDGPLHIAAHSYGGAAALEAARELTSRLESLTLIEPVAFHTLRLAGRATEWERIAEVARKIRAAIREGRDRKAAAVYMGFWVGRIRWWLMPRRQKQGIVSTVRKVAAEFGIMDALTTTLGDYGKIDAPTRLIVGEHTRSPARAVTAVLADTLPRSHRVELRGAGHMSPFTHRDEVHRLILEHIGD